MATTKRNAKKTPKLSKAKRKPGKVKEAHGIKYFLFVMSHEGLSASALSELRKMERETESGSPRLVEFAQDTDRDWNGTGKFGIESSLKIGVNARLRIAVLHLPPEHENGGAGRIDVMDFSNGKHSYDGFRVGTYARLGEFNDRLPEDVLSLKVRRDIIETVRDVRTEACKARDGLPVRPKTIEDCRVLLDPKDSEDDE